MDTTAPKPFIFVLMPFSDNFKDIYELGIKQACYNAGAYCERVDEQIFHENILERVYNQIAKADVIVADMTGRNPNVFYEVGYAHALNKKVILLTQNADDIPFDLKHYSHVVYEGKITSLIAQLEPRVRYFASAKSHGITFPEAQFDMYLGNVLVDDCPNIFSEIYYTDVYEDGLWVFDATLHVHNNSDKVISSKICKIAVILPDDYFSIGKSIVDRVTLPDHTMLSILEFPENLFPGEWKELKFMFALSSSVTHSQLTIPGKLRILRETGSTDHEFTFIIDTLPMMPSDEDAPV